MAVALGRGGRECWGVGWGVTHVLAWGRGQFCECSKPLEQLKAVLILASLSCLSSPFQCLPGAYASAMTMAALLSLNFAACRVSELGATMLEQRLTSYMHCPAHTSAWHNPQLCSQIVAALQSV